MRGDTRAAGVVMKVQTHSCDFDADDDHFDASLLCYGDVDGF